MAAKYSGAERRHEQKDGRQGRRKTDWHCPDHEHIQEATKESRERVCVKIKALNDEVGKMVPWKMFALLFTFSVLVVGSGFGFFSLQVEKIGNKHDRALEIIQGSLLEISKAQAVMADQMIGIKKRQDVLRDAHLKKLLDDKAMEPKNDGD